MKTESISPDELLKRGGEWLGEARAWLQWNTRNGDNVIWGSQQLIENYFTVEQFERFAATIAAAAINEERLRIKEGR